MKKALLIASVLTVATGCSSNSKNDSSVKDGNEEIPVGETAELDMTPGPVVTEINLEDGERISTDWDSRGGREYWMHAPNGQRLSQIYNDGTLLAEGEDPLYTLEDGTEVFEVPVSEAARRCMKIASDTLNKIIEVNPEWLQKFEEKYGNRIYWYGWMNDYTKTTQAREWQQPFNWTGYSPAVPFGQKCYEIQGYIKWVSSIDADNVCNSPSPAQLKKLVEDMAVAHEKEAALNEADPTRCAE